MPELPEVETTVNDLKPHVVGRCIARVDIFTESTIATPPAEEFKANLSGRKINGLSRRGKHLIFKLDNGLFWIVHMRMTGALILKSAQDLPDKFVRVIIYMDNGQAIQFRDVRRFGRMWLVKEQESVTGKLGQEPLNPEFSVQTLSKILKNRKTPIKGLLLDQGLIAGIGNMYADEALYKAKIHPQQPAGTLKRNEVASLFKAIQEVLNQGIQNKGASTETYIRPSGVKGEAHLQFQAAHQKGRTCAYTCGGQIERMVVHQRGTFYCPRCQKLHR